METDSNVQSQSGIAAVRVLSQLFAAVALAYSSVMLLAWWFNVPSLRTIIRGGVPIHPHTAATFIPLCFAVLISARGGRWQSRLALSFAVLVATVGGLRIVAVIFGRPLWVGAADPASGVLAMATSTAIVLVCLGLGCALTVAKIKRAWIPAVVLASIAVGLATATAFEYLFDATDYAIHDRLMSVPTAILTLLAGLSVITSRPPQGVVSTAIEHVSSKWLDLPILYKCFAMASLPVACLVFEIGWQFRVLRDLNTSQQWIRH